MGLVSPDLPVLAVIFLIILWLSAISFLLIRVLRTFSRLTKGVSDQDLKMVLEEVLKEIKKGKEGQAGLTEKLEALRSEEAKCFQRMGLVRYNPFSDTGGNQSFVLALLDKEGTGFVITSLHSREATRVFAKPVIKGKETGFEFSKEEKEAISQAK